MPSSCVGALAYGAIVRSPHFSEAPLLRPRNTEISSFGEKFRFLGGPNAPPGARNAAFGEVLLVRWVSVLRDVIHPDLPRSASGNAQPLRNDINCTFRGLLVTPVIAISFLLFGTKKVF